MIRKIVSKNCAVSFSIFEMDQISCILLFGWGEQKIIMFVIRLSASNVKFKFQSIFLDFFFSTDILLWIINQKIFMVAVIKIKIKQNRTLIYSRMRISNLIYWICWINFCVNVKNSPYSCQKCGTNRTNIHIHRTFISRSLFIAIFLFRWMFSFRFVHLNKIHFQFGRKW